MTGTFLRYWSAPIAPLGVESTDGRWLAPDGAWTLSDIPVPVLVASDGTRYGQIRHLTTLDGHLIAAGTVHSENLATRMASRLLRPEFDMYRHRYTLDITGPHLVHRFTSGQIATVWATDKTNPVWPSLHFHFTVTQEPSWTPAPSTPH